MVVHQLMSSGFSYQTHMNFMSKHTFESGIALEYYRELHGNIAKKTKSLFYRKYLKSKFYLIRNAWNQHQKSWKVYHGSKASVIISHKQNQTKSAVFKLKFCITIGSVLRIFCDSSQHCCQNSKVRNLDYLPIQNYLGHKSFNCCRISKCFAACLTTNSWLILARKPFALSLINEK